MRRLEVRAKARCIDHFLASLRPVKFGTVTGICIPFGRFGAHSVALREVIGPNALDDFIAGTDETRLLLNHEGEALARRSKDGLRLQKTSQGLFVSADIVRTAAGEHAAKLLDTTGGIVGFSFDINFAKSAFQREHIGGAEVRYFSRLWINEISLISAGRVPAFPLAGRISWTRSKA